jgi:hypothetical protein
LGSMSWPVSKQMTGPRTSADCSIRMRGDQRTVARVLSSVEVEA